MTKIFISYSHQDETWKDRICTQLGVLQELSVWEDRQIQGGDNWYPEIQKAIAECDVALLLISAHFLTSKFILGKEIPPLLQRREADGIRVIPMILKPCAWEELPWLNPIQARPKDGRALSGMSEHDADVALCTLAKEVRALSQVQAKPTPTPTPPSPAAAVDLQHMPKGSEHFLGRHAELEALDAAWVDCGQTAIVELIASGGIGKTSLTKHWLGKLRVEGWRGADKVYAWSFYSQGTSEDRQASEDRFLNEALQWFGVSCDPVSHPADKGRVLAQAVAASRTLLVLDGIEPLQYPPGPLAGELRAPGVKKLLSQLASIGHPGLCVVTSRERLEDLNEYERNSTRPDGSVRRINLGQLDDVDGAKLLHSLGVTKAGAGEIGPDDDELKAASHEVKGHALTLTLLGRYLHLAFDGDVRKRDQVDFQEADAETMAGHAFRVIAAYEKWFASTGKNGERELAALRLLGFFDRPASRGSLRVLREAPAILGLTRPLVNLKPELWKATMKRLHGLGVLHFDIETGSVDAHPLVREYFGQSLQANNAKGWKEGHRRLFKQLKESVPHHPDDLSGLEPLYQAVTHGCLAALYEVALDEVYWDRILRGDAAYSTKKVGTFGMNLGAVACFFVTPWGTLAPGLSEANQAWLLNEAAFSLQALGRLEEALEPMRVGGEMQAQAQHEDWKNAAISYSNLSQLQLTLGRIEAAIADAKLAVGYADQSEDAFTRKVIRATLADALAKSGKVEEAACCFGEAEAIQAKYQPMHPYLYSNTGYKYCELLLAEAEVAVWSGEGKAALTQVCESVHERAKQVVVVSKKNNWLLDIALDHLTLGRCILYAALLQQQAPQAAEADLNHAVDGLRKAGLQDSIPLGLLTRALLRFHLYGPEGAIADLSEAEEIASRGGMKLHLADVHLTRARLFKDKAELAKARALIESCGYGRRRQELADAEAALENFQSPPITEMATHKALLRAALD